MKKLIVLLIPFFLVNFAFGDIEIPEIEINEIAVADFWEMSALADKIRILSDSRTDAYHRKWASPEDFLKDQNQKILCRETVLLLAYWGKVRPTGLKLINFEAGDVHVVFIGRTPDGKLFTLGNNRVDSLGPCRTFSEVLTYFKKDFTHFNLQDHSPEMKPGLKLEKLVPSEPSSFNSFRALEIEIQQKKSLLSYQISSRIAEILESDPAETIAEMRGELERILGQAIQLDSKNQQAKELLYLLGRRR